MKNKEKLYKTLLFLSLLIILILVILVIYLLTTRNNGTLNNKTYADTNIEVSYKVTVIGGELSTVKFEN